MEINQICGSKQVEHALSRGEWKLRTRQLPLGQRVQRAREPYKTIFTLAAVSGLRAGELLGLTVADVDFERLTVCPRKQADDRARELRDLKTKKSRTPIPITQETAAVLRAHLKTYWKQNPQGLLFPNRVGRPRKRVNVVKFGLRPKGTQRSPYCSTYLQPSTFRMTGSLFLSSPVMTGDVLSNDLAERFEGTAPFCDDCFVA